MRLLEVKVNNFRNINHIDIKPSAGINLFQGCNAQGKTNLLEAIYYLVTGRSFRARLDRDVIPWNSNTQAVSIIEGKVRSGESDYEIVVGISRNEKKVSCDGRTLASLGLLWGKMNAVLFTPGDLGIIQGAPGNRRRFLDMEGSQVSQLYLFHLQRYNQVIRHRNALLKSSLDEEELAENLDIWDKQIAEPAARIFLFREEFLRELSGIASEIYNGITETSEKMILNYDNFLGSANGKLNEAAAKHLFLEILRQSRAEDLYRGTTSKGPHRDDFIILINGQDARYFASQGQHRSAIIALRLAEIEIMKRRTGREPLLLLDDVVSELDKRRRHHFLSLLDPNLQIFITATDIDMLGGCVPVDKSFQISKGEIVE